LIFFLHIFTETIKGFAYFQPAKLENTQRKQKA